MPVKFSISTFVHVFLVSGLVTILLLLAPNLMYMFVFTFENILNAKLAGLQILLVENLTQFCDTVESVAEVEVILNHVLTYKDRVIP